MREVVDYDIIKSKYSDKDYFASAFDYSKYLLWIIFVEK